MAASITPISAIALPSATVSAAGAPSASGAFQEALGGAIQSVQSSTQNASTAVEQFLSGEGGELHTTIMATERAELTLDLFLQVRNKVVSAYQEIMRMQV